MPLQLNTFATDERGKRILSILRIVTSVLSLILMIVTEIWWKEFRLPILIICFLLAGWYVFFEFIKHIILLKLWENASLFSLSSILSFALGFRHQGIAVLLVFTVADILLELRTKRLQKDYADIYTVRPQSAYRKTETGRTRVSPLDITVGDVVAVPKGELVPVNGTLLSDTAMLDLSFLIGRRKILRLTAGQQVPSGARNEGNEFSLEVTEPYTSSIAEQVLSSVPTTLAKKATPQRIAERVSRFATMCLLLLTLIVTSLVPLFSETSYKNAFGGVCALFLLLSFGTLTASVTATYFGAVTYAVHQGILLRGSHLLDQLRKVTGITFDKTGTITESDFVVEEIVPHNDTTKEELLFYAAVAEQTCQHNISRAIVRTAGKLELPKPEHHLYIEGEGVCAEVDGERIFVGNELLMHRAGIEVLPYYAKGVVCFVGVEDRYIGCLILSDPLKRNSCDAVDGLLRSGVMFVDIVTGDNKTNAENVADVLGARRVFSGLHDQDKLEVLQNTMRRNRIGGKVAFVGDVSADANCLNNADISFAMGVLQNGGGIGKADVTILSDDPADVLTAIRLSGFCHQTNLVNITLALSVKIVLAGLVLGGVLPLYAVAISEGMVQCFLSLFSTRRIKLKTK